MDISLLAINSKKRSIQWSGANNPLWYFKTGLFYEIKSDKQPIGKFEHRKPFAAHDIPFYDSTVFYLFTDGYADQFGGPKGKKFKYSQFRELLMQHHMKPLAEQQRILAEAIGNWKGDLGQVDDICVIGIRI
jgi:serine phosphatase RsbU (regulator of sigma subunit)